MDVNTFNLKMLGFQFLQISDDYYAFRRKHGRWDLWNAKNDTDTLLGSTKELLQYKIGDVTVSDILDELEEGGSFAITLDGGRGASSAGGQTFSFGHAAKRMQRYSHPDFPARINVATKTKNVESAIKTFMNKAAERPDYEHGITLDNMGFASQYVHGAKHSVAIGSKNKGDLIVHNHPGGGSFFGC